MNKTDSRYRKTEVAIFSALSRLIAKNPHTTDLKPTTLARKSHISKATFYRHYKSIDDIFRTKEERLIKNYRLLIRRRNAGFRASLRTTLLFIYINRDYFGIIFQRNHERPIRAMLAILCPHNENLRSAVQEIRFYEFYSTLKRWSEHNFSEHEINVTLSSICYLFNSAKNRLTALGTLDTRVLRTYNRLKGEKHGTKTA